MRRYKALVIHDDPKIVDELSEVRESLGHEHQWARSQAEARQLLSANDDYAYILLDLEIPARPKYGQARLRNGMNLLEEIRGDERLHGVPVILIARRCLAKLRLVVWVMKHGAFDVIEKPLPVEGYTLDRAIKKALIYHHATSSQGAAVLVPARPVAPQPFRGGEMVLYPDRVELCGVKIVGDTGIGHSRAILDLLAQKQDGIRYVHISSEAMARKIGAEGGGGTVIGCIRTIRESIAARLRGCLNLVCGRDDVITNDGFHGYCLKEWIAVRHAADNVTGSAPRAGEPARQSTHEPVPEPVGERIAAPVVEPVSEPVNEPLTERQERILHVLGKGDSLRVPAIACRTRASRATVKRELARLKGRGLVAFEGPPRSGRYRLTTGTQC